MKVALASLVNFMLLILLILLNCFSNNSAVQAGLQSRSYSVEHNCCEVGVKDCDEGYVGCCPDVDCTTCNAQCCDVSDCTVGVRYQTYGILFDYQGSCVEAYVHVPWLYTGSGQEFLEVPDGAVSFALNAYSAANLKSLRSQTLSSGSNCCQLTVADSNFTCGFVISSFYSDNGNCPV